MLDPLLLQSQLSINQQNAELFSSTGMSTAMVGSSTAVITTDLDMSLDLDGFEPGLSLASQYSHARSEGHATPQALLLTRISVSFLVSELQAMRVALQEKELQAMAEETTGSVLAATEAELAMAVDELQSREFIAQSADARAAMAEASLMETRQQLELLREEHEKLKLTQRVERAEAQVRETELKRARQDASEARDMLSLSDASLRVQKEAATARTADAAEAEAGRRALQDALEETAHRQREAEFETRRVQKSLHKRLAHMAQQLASSDVELGQQAAELAELRVGLSQTRMALRTSREAGELARMNEEKAVEAQQEAERKVSELRRHQRAQRELSREAIEEAESNKEALAIAANMRRVLMGRMMEVGWQLARLERTMDFRCCAPPSPRLQLNVQDLLASTRKAHHYGAQAKPRVRTDGSLDVRHDGNKVTYLQKGEVIYTSSHGLLDSEGGDEGGAQDKASGGGFEYEGASGVDSTLDGGLVSGSSRHHMGCGVCPVNASVDGAMYGKPKQKQQRKKRKKSMKAGAKGDAWAMVLEEELLQRMLAWDWADHVAATGKQDGQGRADLKAGLGAGGVGGVGSEGDGMPTKNLSLMRAIFECYCRVPVRDWQYEGSRQASQHVQHYRRMLLPHARLYETELAAVQSVEGTHSRDMAAEEAAASTGHEDFAFGGSGDGSSSVSSGGMSVGQAFLFLEQAGLVEAPLRAGASNAAQSAPESENEPLLSELQIMDAFEIASQTRWTKKVQSRVLRIDHRDTVKASSGGGVGGGGMAVTPRLLSFSEFVAMVVRLSHSLYSDLTMTDQTTVSVYAFGPAADKGTGNFSRHGVNHSYSHSPARPSPSPVRAVRSFPYSTPEARVQLPGDENTAEPCPWSDTAGASGYDPMTQRLTLGMPTEKATEEQARDEFEHEVGVFQEEGPETTQPAFLAEMACKLLLRIAQSERMWQQVRFVGTRRF
jgi:chemotaxis protein histidine kinase CheA